MLAEAEKMSHEKGQEEDALESGRWLTFSEPQVLDGEPHWTHGSIPWARDVPQRMEPEIVHPRPQDVHAERA